MRDRLSDIASWRFAAAAALTTLVVAGIVAIALGLGADEEPLRTPGTATVTDAPATVTTVRRRPRRPTAAAEVRRAYREMTVPERVAQLFLLGFRGQDLTAPVYATLRERPLGGIVVDAHNYAGVDLLAAIAGEPAAIAAQEGHPPPWVLAPQEGGRFNAFGDLPPATAAADLPSAAAAYDEAREAAATLRGLGLTGVLAPVLDVAPPDGVAVGERAFSDHPGDVADYARAFVDGFRSYSMLTAAGHFPGLGAGSQDTRRGPSRVGADLADLRARDMAPFRAAIAAGVPAITISNGLYVTDDFVTPGSLSPTLIGLLRRDLGFRGLVVTDDLADPAVTALTDIPRAAVAAVRAGADLLYVSGPPAEQEAAYAAVLSAARRGRVSPARLREAVLRNLSVKHNYGVLAAGG